MLGDAYLDVGGGTQFRCFGFATEKIRRDPSFATITNDDIVCFKEILGDNNVIQDEDRLSSANMDWIQRYEGSSQLLLLPRSTQEVQLFFFFHLSLTNVKFTLYSESNR